MFLSIACSRLNGRSLRATGLSTCPFCFSFRLLSLVLSQCSLWGQNDCAHSRWESVPWPIVARDRGLKEHLPSKHRFSVSRGSNAFVSVALGILWLRMTPGSQGSWLQKISCQRMEGAHAAQAQLPQIRGGRVNTQASSVPQQGLPFPNSLPLMLASVVFPLTQHLASGGEPVGKTGGGGTMGQRVPKPQKDGQPATSPNRLDTCFGKTVTESQSRTSSPPALPPYTLSAVGPSPLHTSPDLTSAGNLQGYITFHQEYHCVV